MSKTVDFLEWIRSGRLMGVALGDSKMDVESRMGPPVGWATDSAAQAASFREADIWGYGVWSVYFECDALDAITCAVESLTEHGWHFELNGFDEKLLGSISEVQQVLNSHGIQSQELKKKYRLLDAVDDNVVEISCRLGLPVLLAGTGFRTRAIFDMNTGNVRVFGNPFSLRHQVLSNARICDLNRFQLLGGPG